MAILDIFKRKSQTNAKESNTLFGQTALGNNVLRNANSYPTSAAYQLLYVTTSSVTEAGRTVDMSVLSRNSTIMSCIGLKARAVSQLPIKVMAYGDDGTLVDACTNPNVQPVIKPKRVLLLVCYKTQIIFKANTNTGISL